MKRAGYLITAILLSAGILSSCGGKGGQSALTLLSQSSSGAETEGAKQPAATPTVTPTFTPTPTAVTEPENPTPAAFPTPIPDPHEDLSFYDPLDFFKDVVYCGDSNMNLYQWLANYSTHPEIFGKRVPTSWLTMNSYSVRLALKKVDKLTEEEAACVPKFQGQPVNLWDAVAWTGKTRVIMFFGLNDIGWTGIDWFIKNYEAVIANIKWASPNAKFYILSITPMRKDMERGDRLCNEKIREANERLKQMCEENGWTYVDVASKLCDENGDLILELPDGTKISDGTNVHLTRDGYVFWDEALERLAREELRKEYYERLAAEE